MVDFEKYFFGFLCQKMYTNIENDTLVNEKYRDVVYTDEKLQVVYMSLKNNETIHFEIHNGSQFIRVESGAVY